MAGPFRRTIPECFFNTSARFGAAATALTHWTFPQRFQRVRNLHEKPASLAHSLSLRSRVVYSREEQTNIPGVDNKAG